jgi:hypothetical protein
LKGHVISGDFCYTEQVSDSTTAPWDSGKEEKEKRTTELGTLKRRKRLADSPGPDRLLVHNCAYVLLPAEFKPPHSKKPKNLNVFIFLNIIFTVW